MDTIYSLLKRAKELKEKSQVDSITPEEVGKLHEDTLAYIASLEQSADGLGIKKVYQSKSAMEADTDPVGTNGKTLRYGQLVSIYDDAHADSSENGNIYAYQKPGWLLMGKVSGGTTLSITQELGDSATKVMSQKAVTNLITECDVSAINEGTAYSLQDAINAVPEALQKGGLTIRFINRDTDDYVSWICREKDWTTSIEKWSEVRCSEKIKDTLTTVNADLSLGKTLSGGLLANRKWGEVTNSDSKWQRCLIIQVPEYTKKITIVGTTSSRGEKSNFALLASNDTTKNSNPDYALGFPDIYTLGDGEEKSINIDEGVKFMYVEYSTGGYGLTAPVVPSSISFSVEKKSDIACNDIGLSSKNLFDKDNAQKGIGLDYAQRYKYTNVGDNVTYRVLVTKGKTYAVSGYNNKSTLGGGQAVTALIYKKDGVFRNLQTSDFAKESNWISRQTHFLSNSLYIAKSMSVGEFVFETPTDKDLTIKIDELYFVLQTKYQNIEVPVDTIQIEEGLYSTSYKPFKLEVENINGVPLRNEFDNSKAIARPNYGYQRNFQFLGDSITYGGWCEYVKKAMYLNVAKNSGIVSLTSFGLALKVTGLLRETPNLMYEHAINGADTSDKTVDNDFSKYDAVTIQIGTNDYKSTGSIADIPNISVYDIPDSVSSSSPYNYINGNGTVKQAVITNKEEYFSKLFPISYYGNIAMVIEWIRWKNANCRIFVISVPASDNGFMGRIEYNAMNNSLKEICDFYSIPFIDAIGNSGYSAKYKKVLRSDAVHPNAVGYKLWGKYIANELMHLYYPFDL